MVGWAPKRTTIVVFHSAVLAYVADPLLCERFMTTMRALGVVWVGNEAPGVFPSVRERLPCKGLRGAFLLLVDGVPTAWTDPHGAWIE